LRIYNPWKHSGEAYEVRDDTEYEDDEDEDEEDDEYDEDEDED